MEKEYLGTAGVYKITHIPTGKYYIGATKDLYHRWYSHLASMKYNHKTSNSTLKELWKQTPTEDAFRMQVLEVTADDREILNNRERDYLAIAINDDNCVNRHKKAFRSRYGQKCTEQHKRRLSESQCRRRGNRKSTVRLVSPEGRVYETNNVAAFAREHNLTQPLLNQVASGKTLSHKGWTLEGTTMKVIEDQVLSDFKGNTVTVTNDNWAEVAEQIESVPGQFRMFLYKPERHAIQPGWFKVGIADQIFVVENEDGERFIIPDLNGAKRIFCILYGLSHQLWAKLLAKKRLKSGEFVEGWRVVERRLEDHNAKQENR